MRLRERLTGFANQTYSRMKRQPLLAPLIALAQKINNDDLTTHATVLAYNFFFALPAALLFLVAALAYLPVDNLSARITEQLAGVVPADAIDLVGRTADKALERGPGTVTLLIVSFWGAVYGMTGGYSSMITAVNKIFGLKETRGWWRVKLLSFAMSAAAAVLMVTAFALLIIAPSLADAFENHKVLEGLAFLLRPIRWPAILLLVLTGIEVSYRYAPCRPPRFRFISPGALIAAFVWIIATYLFGIYVNNFGSYDKVYGTLGAVIVLITWIWLSSLVFLVGAAINALWIEQRGPRLLKK
ncbi:MAG: YihY/virulence factor BrkB family protein [Actinobacteria bacterium]|nr:YihY/virulence factor BrkB family protein [Actinomycetota bacterium]MCL5882947.1 YihY/virulence factor BrkB family protein [Actinomycetota bacterium]